MAEKTKILIVCTGNTCRSPMAEYLLRELLHRDGKADRYQVESAGLAAFDGEPISENAAMALRDRGIDAFAHQARQLTAALVTEADRIYVMTASHRSAILSVLPESASKIKVLAISDPYGGDLACYRACLNELESYFKQEKFE